MDKSSVIYDLVIIGAGPAGYVAAQEASAKGMKTALVEKRELGGTCLNRGCIPTKTILHSAELFAQMKSCEQLGISAKNVTCDMARIQERKEEVLEQLRAGIAMLMKKGKVDVYYGTATIAGPHEVTVRTEDAKNAVVLSTDKILIATGSVPSVPPIPGSHLPGVVTSDELLAKKELYPRLTIIGGGVIGMEFASIYSALGCQVTVIEFLDRILANMDKEISQNLKMILKKRGVDIHTGAKVEEILESPGGLICRYREKDTQRTEESDGILVAAGRKVSTDGLFAPEVKVAMERGRILVNAYGQTSVPNIYAAGDVTPGIQLAHAASAEAVNAVAHMVRAKNSEAEGTAAFLQGQEPGERSGKTGAESNGLADAMHMDVIPSCVYTSPEIGCVGLTQEEAKSKNIDVIVKKYPMSANGKSVLTRQERGFIKVVAEKEGGRILGAQMMCARATDMISEFGTAIANGLTLKQMAGVIRPHPSFSEGISEAVK
ncbi:MAG: FAD-dependent oxidoreductase [Lachnospiraceae bacterium]|nr:FAD-dependent oxidoreductase [Lachnospiraceae bacterium]